MSLEEFMAKANNLNDDDYAGGGERAPRSQRVGGRSMAFDSKPGDWNCAECGITVFASKQQCFRCRAYKPAAARADGAPARGSKMGRREQSVDFSREEGENFDMRDARKRDLLASSRGLPQSRSSRGRGRGGRGGANARSTYSTDEEGGADKGSAQALWKARIRRQKEEQRKKNMDATVISDIDGGFFLNRVNRAKKPK